SSRRRHTRFSRDWSSDVCSSDLDVPYQKWRGVVFPGQGKPLHGDKSLDGELWNGHWEKLGFQIQIQVLPGVFQNVLPNQGEAFRSEERRVGKEIGSRGEPQHGDK